MPTSSSAARGRRFDSHLSMVMGFPTVCPFPSHHIVVKYSWVLHKSRVKRINKIKTRTKIRQIPSVVEIKGRFDNYKVFCFTCHSASDFCLTRLWVNISARYFSRWYLVVVTHISSRGDVFHRVVSPGNCRTAFSCTRTSGWTRHKCLHFCLAIFTSSCKQKWNRLCVWLTYLLSDLFVRGI